MFWAKDAFNKLTPSGVIDLASVLSIEVQDQPARILLAFPGLHGWTLRASIARPESAAWPELLQRKQAEAIEVRASLKDNAVYKQNLESLVKGTAFVKKPSPADVDAVFSGDEDATGVHKSAVDNAVADRPADSTPAGKGAKEKRKSLSASFSMVLDRLKSPTSEYVFEASSFCAITDRSGTKTHSKI